MHFLAFCSALPARNDTLERARRSTYGPGAALKAEQTVGAELRRSVFLRPGLPVHLFSLGRNWSAVWALVSSNGACDRNPITDSKGNK